jgi:hypothetical protein
LWAIGAIRRRIKKNHDRAGLRGRFSLMAWPAAQSWGMRLMLQDLR